MIEFVLGSQLLCKLHLTFRFLTTLVCRQQKSKLDGEQFLTVMPRWKLDIKKDSRRSEAFSFIYEIGYDANDSSLYRQVIS